MDSEMIITIKIAITDDGLVVTAVQSAAGEEQILAIPALEAASGTTIPDLPPPPEGAAFESMAAEVQLPPVPVLEEAGAFESMGAPDLPPVPEVDHPEIFEGFESLAIPELPPVPDAPEEEVFK